ncbi:hypothetical protein AV654_02430 [Paenibacillus elgii]|uniref:Uncharacterized protein n=1 Tax=Paenibacillus elgii TaxID=189691 RepID=A0A163XY13_9BACL|nr:hypothetical protein [Paenibacillus elgii]KZE78626.1 hypothetical protein AV654_02430 [Paenibacillus elgii]
MAFKVKTRTNKAESVNRDLYHIIKDYFHCSSIKELTFDILIPVFVSILIFATIGAMTVSTTTILKIIVNLNTSSINVMAILAGFNTASVAVIASTNKSILNQLYNVTGPQNNTKKNKNFFANIWSIIVEKKDENILKITISFFSYAIAMQLIILILGSIIVATSDNVIEFYRQLSFINKMSARIIISILGTTWLTLILHCLFVSLRNVSLLYRYVLFLGKNKDDKSTD